ncbi:MAG: sigma-70 family RNA polymerase sigma factor [Gemmataceae bacterium]
MVATVNPPQAASEFLAGVHRWLAKLSCRFAARHQLDPDEVLSVVALAILRQHGSYDPSRGKPTTWAHRVFLTAAYRHLDRERTQRRRFHPHPLDSDRLTLLAARRAGPALSAADRAKVAKAIDKLPPKQRAAVEDRHWRGETQLEIAQRAGTSRQAVSQLERAAYRRLRLALFDLE